MDYNYKEILKDKRWLEKRDEIFERDNYTCHECKKFIPSNSERLIINKDTGNFEIHSCFVNTGEYQYTIYSSETGITIHIYFFYLDKPCLNLHHVFYIKDTDPWASAYDDHLITLCNFCHEKLHKSKPIKFYTKDGKFIDEKIIEPQDHSGVVHNRPTLPENKSNTHLMFGFFVPENQFKEIDLIYNKATKMFENFVERFFNISIYDLGLRYYSRTTYSSSWDQEGNSFDLIPHIDTLSNYPKNLNNCEFEIPSGNFMKIKFNFSYRVEKGREVFIGWTRSKYFYLFPQSQPELYDKILSGLIVKDHNSEPKWKEHTKDGVKEKELENIKDLRPKLNIKLSGKYIKVKVSDIVEVSRLYKLQYRSILKKIH